MDPGSVYRKAARPGHRFGMAIAACLLWAVAATAGRAEATRLLVVPSTTDPAIRRYDDPHRVFLDREIVVDRRAGRPACRDQLLLWITGTNGKGRSVEALATLAAELGYHVIILIYANDLPATSCARDDSADTFEAFRLAIIRGGRAPYQRGNKELSILRVDSIEHRLIRAIESLRERRPAERWGQFLKDDGSIRWSSIAVAGQSQGGGHAALIGIKHEVARVLCFGAPKDFNKNLGVPAGWYRLESATPKDRFFALNHHRDPRGCTPEQQRLNLEALGLGAFGPAAEVDTEPAPYRHARILYTAYPHVVVTGVASEGAKTAHGSVSSGKYAPRREAVWRYMLTE